MGLTAGQSRGLHSAVNQRVSSPGVVSFNHTRVASRRVKMLANRCVRPCNLDGTSRLNVLEGCFAAAHLNSVRGAYGNSPGSLRAPLAPNCPGRIHHSIGQFTNSVQRRRATVRDSVRSETRKSQADECFRSKTALRVIRRAGGSDPDPRLPSSSLADSALADRHPHARSREKITNSDRPRKRSSTAASPRCSGNQHPRITGGSRGGIFRRSSPIAKRRA